MNLTPAKDTFKLTQERRETYAREIFAYETVTTAMIAAATRGEGYLRIAQTLAASLRSTKAAGQLIGKLKEAGYNVEWVDASIAERVNGNETGAFILFDELRITWAAIRIHSGPQAMPAD